PDSKKQIKDVIDKYGNDFDLFGCITNRLNKTHQLYNNFISEESDILEHKKIADKLHEEKYCQVIETHLPIAGCFMLFNKDTWERFKFKENNLLFDTLFCKELLKNDHRIGIIEGLYLFHFYRLDKEDPKNIDHLRR